MEPDGQSLTMERVLEKYDSKFRFVLLAAARAEQLVRGARPKLDLPGRSTRLAMEEVKREQIPWSYGPPPVEEPEEGGEELSADAEDGGGEAEA